MSAGTDTGMLNRCLLFKCLSLPRRYSYETKLSQIYSLFARNQSSVGEGERGVMASSVFQLPITSN